MVRLLVALALLIGGALSAGQAVQAAQRSTLTAMATDSVRGAFDTAVSVGLFVGIRDFQNSAEFREVPYAVDDAVDLAYLFASTLKLIPAPRITLVLSGVPQKPDSVARLAELRAQGASVQPANFTQLMALLARAKSDVGAAGLLVVSMATHGYEERLLAADSSIATLDFTSVPVDHVIDQVEGSKAGRRLVLLDTCREIREVGRNLPGNPEVAMSPGFAAALSMAEGTVVLAATTRGGFSYDDPVRRNGVFSGAIVDGLSGQASSNADGFVTVDTLTDFVNGRVTSWVAKNRERDVAVSRGISLSAEPTTLRSMPLAEHPQRRQLELKWAQGVLRGAFTERYPGFTGLIFDEIEARLTAPGVVLEQLFHRLRLLETQRAAYAPDFALWWSAKGIADTSAAAPPVTTTAPTTTAPTTSAPINPVARSLLTVPARINGALEATDAVFSVADRRFVDEYTFRGTMGQHLRIEMDGGLDGFLLLVTAQERRLIKEDDDSAGGVNPRIVVTLPANGEYAILVTTYRDADAKIGAYALRVEAVDAAAVAAANTPPPVTTPTTVTPPPPPPPAVAVWTPVNGRRVNPSLSARISGGLATSDPRFGAKRADEYVLQGARGQRVRVKMEAAFDAYLMLFSADGRRLIAEDDDTDGSNPVLDVTLEADGRYLIVATSYEDATTGSYTIRVESLLEQNVVARGVLEGGDERRDDRFAEYWVFDGTAGQRVRIVMEGDFDTFLRLMKDNDTLATNDDADGLGVNSAIEFTLRTTGTYTVVGAAYESQAGGAYTLRLTTVPAR